MGILLYLYRRYIDGKIVRVIFWKKRHNCRMAKVMRQNELADDPVAGFSTMRRANKSLKVSYARRLGIAAIAQAGMSSKDIALSEGVSERTVCEIRSKEMFNPDTAAFARKNIANKFYNLVNIITDGISPAKIAAMSAYQLAGMAAMLYDKARLADGLSTQNLQMKSVAVNLNADLSEVRALKQKLLARLQPKGKGDAV